MKPDLRGQARLAAIVEPPAVKRAPAPERLPVATELVTRLRESGIRYGVYKNRQYVDSGLAGLNDLDLLVATADVARFEQLLDLLKAVRGRPHPLHDNAVEGRSQWFVPDFSNGDYLHLDVVAGLRIGHRFAKHHLALDYDDVLEWEVAGAPLSPIPIVSRHEEARIALLKAAYDLPLWRRHDWVRLDDRLSRLMRGAMADPGRGTVFRYRFGAEEVNCRIRTRAGHVEVEHKATRRLIELVRSDGHCERAEWADLARHHGRQLAYGVTRLFFAATPLASIRKVALPSGILVALIGPDGVGKSTQTARLDHIFRKKFRCTTVYLGSGDGGWGPRRRARRAFEKWRGRARAAAERSTGRGRNGLASALWGAVTGIERYLALRKAGRAAARGLIVIADRWPQNLRAGYLDGPRCPPDAAAGAASWLSGVEHRLYRRMAEVKPTETIHLVSTFETSNARKPGDIDRPAFERRLALMRTMRRCDRGIKTVDAGATLDEVTRKLFRIVWLALWRATANEPLRSGKR